MREREEQKREREERLREDRERQRAEREEREHQKAERERIREEQQGKARERQREKLKQLELEGTMDHDDGGGKFISAADSANHDNHPFLCGLTWMQSFKYTKFMSRKRKNFYPHCTHL